MKSRIKLLIIFFVMSVFLISGCGIGESKKNTGTSSQKKTTLSVEEELVQFVNVDLPGISEDRDTVVERINSYFSENSNQDAGEYLQYLENEALTKYDAYLENLEAIAVTNEEVIDLKALYVESAKLQREAISDMAEALKNTDSSKMEEAKKKLSESQVKLKQYEDEVQTLCTKYNIRTNGSFSD